MHLRSLERHPFDSVLLPYSYAALQDEAYRPDVEELLAVCEARGVAVQTIKSAARRRWPADHEGRRFSWYQPIDDAEALGRAVRWVLAQAPVFVNTTSDGTLVPTVLDAAEAAAAGAEPPSDTEMAADADRLGIAPLFDGDALERI
jgi:hypothetical protein